MTAYKLVVCIVAYVGWFVAAASIDAWNSTHNGWWQALPRGAVCGGQCFPQPIAYPWPWDPNGVKEARHE